MRTRRHFLKAATVLGLAGTSPLSSRAAGAGRGTATGAEDRAYWVSVADRLGRPILSNLARRELKRRMPVEEQPGSDRRSYIYLEALGRLLGGMAPWLELENAPPAESRLQREFIGLAQDSLDAATDPGSPDFMNFRRGGQPLVDTAFLAQGILRARTRLWQSLPSRVREQVIAALKSSRTIATPKENNWVMFAAMVEAALLEFGEPTVEERLEDCVSRMLTWYCGDGAYGDGGAFHFDYYNSFVIQPMLLDVLSTLKNHDSRFISAHAVVLRRAQRFAAVQERLIAPDGTFPSLGRSTTYRFGAFQILAQVALMDCLPRQIRPAQVRCGLTAVMRRMMEAPWTFDENGWLQIGFCGHQPALGEAYISTGSLYLCAAGLLPLGLPATAEFWSAPGARWTSQGLWAGENLASDHALADERRVEVPILDRQKGKSP